MTRTPTPTPTSGGPRPAQPAGLTAFHRAGQTFLTWSEVGGLAGERYHIYRHTAPITAANLGQARRLTERWGPLAEGSSIFWTERDREPPITANYVINDLAAPLADTTGLFVWTSHDAGAFYYAVTTVHDGVENRADFGLGNSLAAPLSETPADPQPVLAWRDAGGRGAVFTQYLDYESYNPTFDAPRGDRAPAVRVQLQRRAPLGCGVRWRDSGQLPDLPLHLRLGRPLRQPRRDPLRLVRGADLR